MDYSWGDVEALMNARDPAPAPRRSPRSVASPKKAAAEDVSRSPAQSKGSPGPGLDRGESIPVREEEVCHAVPNAVPSVGLNDDQITFMM